MHIPNDSFNHAALLCLLFVVPLIASSDELRVLSPGQLLADSRLGPLKDLNGYFPFNTPNTLEEWKIRSESIRVRMRVALGLWPPPKKTPLNTVIHDRLDFGDYTVEKVYFESMPSFYVTGGLYRPITEGKHPAVLSPHGHFSDGRFHDEGLEDVKKEIAVRAERFEEGGRSALQSRCVELARLGCVVLLYDMIGYADSVQVPYSVAHGFEKQRPEMNTTENWGLLSPQAETHCQNVMGLQTWNSIRALDFLESLPDVDPKRIGVTGESGGGTQTFILCALDPRPAVAFPAVMVSTAMQGGCTCENACDLRIGTSNVEFAALFAPKPLGMTAANDWTKEMASKGFPEMKKLYAMYGYPQNVMLAPFLQFGHNFNMLGRGAMYSWLNKHLHLNAKEPIVERDYHLLSPAEMTVWDSQHPAPNGGPEFERKLLAWWNKVSQISLAPVLRSPKAYRIIFGNAFRILLGRTMSEAGEVEWLPKSREGRRSFSLVAGLIRNLTYNEELPVVQLIPEKVRRAPVVWVDEGGKSGLFTANGAPRESILKLLDAGATVIGVDLLCQGEFLADGLPIRQARLVDNPREALAYTFGYNDSLFAQRVHDILTVVKFAQDEYQSKQVDVVGLNGVGIWVGAACAVAEDAIGAAAVDTGGFRFGIILDIRDPNFLPGGAKYGDMPGMLALHAPYPLWLTGEPSDGAKYVRNQYGLHHSGRTFEYFNGQESMEHSAVEWLLKDHIVQKYIKRP